MRRYRYLVLAACAALLAAAPALPAAAGDPSVSAGAVLTYGSSAGPDVGVGDALSASLKAGTTARFTSTAGGSTGATCTASSFSATVTSNPAAPGTATESLTNQTFGSCTENISGVLSVQSITVDNLPYNASVSSSTGVVTVTGSSAAIQTTVVLNTLLGRITCRYQANGGAITGDTSDVDNSITFSDEQFNKTSGPSLCFNNGFFSAIYAPVVDNTQGGAAVFVN